ncbi:MAG: hypothetical protein ACE5JG_03985, partial [Planctomycetota bacterium]
GDLSAETRRQARAKLSELRHYVLTSQARFFLDEHHVQDFHALYERLREALGPPPGGARGA